MEKEEEDTRELLLPNWQGSGSMGITLDKTDDGVFVKQLVQDSPAAKTGVVKEGDQIVGATVYFDSMSSEDIERLLTNVGHHTVGLKLQRKGDRSPQPGMTWSHDVFSLKSPDVVLSGDDEEYRRIYTKKIKPRLKSEEFLEPETQTRTITVTRKVTAYTVDVTGSKGTKEIDISSPEYKIKIPKHEITEISKTSIETEQGKTVIKIPSADISGRTFEIGKEINLETKGSGVSVTGGTQSTSNSSVYSQVTNAGTFGFHGINSDGNISISSKDSPSFSGPKYQSYEQHIDVKGSVYEATQKDQLRSLHDSETSSIDIQMKGSLLKGAEADRAGKSTINTDFASMDKTFGISKGGFQSSTIMLKETRFDMQKPGGFTVEQSDIGVKVPQTDINLSAQKSKSDISLSPVYRRELSGDQMVKSYPESYRGISVQSTEIKSQMPSIKVPLSVSGKEAAAGDTDLKLQGPATAINVASPDIQAATLQIDGKIQSAGIKLKDYNFDISSLSAEAPDVAVLSPKTDVKDLKGEVKGSTFKMSSKNVNLPKVPMTDVNLHLEGSKAREIDISIPVLEGGLKGPQIETERSKLDVEVPESVDLNLKGPALKWNIDRSITTIEGGKKVVELEGAEEELKMPKFKMPKFGFSGPKVEVKDVDIKLREGEIDMPDIDLNLKCPKLDGDLKAPKVDIKAPGVDFDAPDINIDGKVKGHKFKMPSMPKVSMPDLGLNVKGPKVEGELKAPTIDMKGPEVDVAIPDVELEGPEGKLKMPKFKMPKFGVSGSKVEGKDIDITLPEGEIDVSGPKVDIRAPQLDIECPEGKVKGPTFKMPSLHMPDIDLNFKGPKLEGDLKATKVDIKAPGVDFEAPDIDINGKVKGHKFKMPSMPKVSMPDLGFNVKGPKVEGELKAPTIDMKGPEVDVAIPDVELEGPEGKLKMPKFKMPTFGVSGSKVEGKDIDITLPEREIDVSGPNVDISAPQLDIECPEGKVKGPTFKMPSLHMPDIDLNLKGPKLEGDLKAPKVDIKAPGVDFEAPDIGIDGKVKGHKFKMPSMPKVSMPDLGFNVKGPKVEGELKAPTIDMKGPEVDVAIPDVELEGPEGKLKMPKFKMPKFGVSGSKAEGKDIDITLPEGQMYVLGPKVDINAAELDIECPEGKVKGSKFKMPSLHMPDIDLNFKGPKLEGDLKGPKVDIKAPEANLEGPDIDFDGKVKGPKFKMPSMPKVSMPDLGLNVKGPKVGELKAPTIDMKGPEVDVAIPDVELEGPEGKLKMPTFKMPKFGFSGSKGEDIDITLPEGEIDVLGPKVDIRAPQLDIECPEGKVKGSKFKIPSLHMPDIDLNLKGPKLEGDLKGPKVDIKAPEANLEGPDIDFDGKLKGPKFKMPSMPKVSMPDVGLNLKGPKVEGELKGPNIDMKGPEVDVTIPDVELEGPEGKLKMPKFKMPKFGFSGPKVEGKDIDITLPEGEIDISGPKVDINTPQLDIECPEGKVKGPKYKMPSLHMPDIDLNLKGPKLEGDLKGPKVDIKAPDFNLEATDIDFDGKVKGPKFKMPSMPKVSMPELGLNVTGPKVEGELKGPNIDMKGTEFDVAFPDAELEGPEGKLKMPKFQMPKFGFSGPKVKGKDVDITVPEGEIDASGPKVDISAPQLDIKCPEGKVKGPAFKMPSLHMPDIDLNLKGPKLEGDLKGPKVDIKAPEYNLEATDIDFDGKVKGPKFKMPSMPKVSMPDLGLNVKGPNVEGKLERPDIDMKAPEVNIDIPEVELEGPEGKLKMPTFKMPKFGFSSPKVEGKDIDFTLPEGEMDLSGAKVDINAPELDIECPEGKVKGPKFKTPSLHMPDLGFNLKGPKLEGDLKGPKVDIKALEVNLEAPDVGVDGKVKGPKFKMPKISTQDIDLNLKGPKLEGDLKVPTIDMNLPEIDAKMSGISLEGPEGKLKKPKFGFGSKSPKSDINVPSVDISIPEVEVNAEMPEIGVAGKGKKGKLKMPKIHMSGPKIKGKKGGFDVNTPELDSEVSMKTPDADIDISGGDATIKSDFSIKATKTRKPLFGKIHFPDVEFDIKSSKLKGDASLPSPKAATGTFDLGIGAGINTQAELSSTGLDIEGLDVKGKKSKIKLPAFSMSGAKLESDLDISPSKDSINISGIKLEGDLKTPSTNVNLGTLDADLSMNLEGPKIEMPSLCSLDPKVSVPESDLNMAKPKILGVTSGFTDAREINLRGQGLSLKGNLTGQFKETESMHVEGAKVGSLVQAGADDMFIASGTATDTQSSAVKVTFPRLLMPRFTGPEHFGREMGVDVDFPKVETTNLGQADLELEESDIKIKKSRIKMPKFNFSKGKGKGEYSLPGVSGSGSKGDLKSSKASLGSAEGVHGSASVEVESGKGISLREKSPKYEFSLFTSKKPRHRSSSMSEDVEGSSPSGTMELDSGGVSLEGGKKKSKHSKIKFGTFGGLGSKSKGSYEVTLSDDENIQGSGASLSSRKSRVSSSSSNDSGTKAGVKLPKVELTVAKKKE